MDVNFVSLVMDVKQQNGDGECRWARPDLPSKCTYKLGETSTSESPHRHLTRSDKLFSVEADILSVCSLVKKDAGFSLNVYCIMIGFYV
jgi:hypothetical protein